MLKITVLCVGKIKEKYFTSACEEYLKRLSRYARMEVVEVPDEKTPDGASEKDEARILETEGARLLARMPEGAHVIALAIEGEAYTSPQLARWIDSLTTKGQSHLVFVIGGSLGLSPEVLSRADAKLSFSRMTFPHQLMRVILLEQLYRSFRILRNEPYHK